ncbi:MAG: glycosyltransferase [Gammaproteobacteria bacterium]|nr:glycosyltransferase [Gammaproteobacteria bacterium]
MPAQKPITLTVSVVVYDTDTGQLHALLESLLTALAALPAVGLQVVTHISLVDNSEQQRLRLADFAGFRTRLKTRHAVLNLVTGHGNVGYGRGHNLVIHSHDHHYHLILNPDVELAADSLAVGLFYLEQHPQVALVSPSAVAGDGDKQHLCKRDPSVFTLVIRGFCPAWLKKLFSERLAHYEMHDLPEDRPSTGIPHASGCCMLCRAEALRGVKGFDDKYFLYFEDFDLSRRLSRQGWVVYLPAMKIRHHGGNAAGKGLAHIAMYTRSAWRFFNTWGWRLIQ